MSKGGYLGGSSVVGFSGSFTGTRAKKLSQASNVAAHLTQKAKRDEARKAASATGRKKKPALSKAERQAENEARAKLRDAPREVIVEHRANGEIVSARTVRRS